MARQASGDWACVSWLRATGLAVRQSAREAIRKTVDEKVRAEGGNKERARPIRCTSNPMSFGESEESRCCAGGSSLAAGRLRQADVSADAGGRCVKSRCQG